VPALLEQLKFGDSYEKTPLLETLAGIGPGAIDAFDPLLELMKKSDDNDSTLRENAKKALEAIAPDDPRLAEAMRAELRDEGDMRRYIEEHGREAGPLLLDLLKTGSPQSKVLSIEFLQELFPKGAKAALEAALDDSDPQVQQAAAAALVPFGTPNARQLDLLMSAFLSAKEDEDIDWKIRGALQNSMRKLGPRLIASLADTDLSLVKRQQALELLMSSIYLLKPLQTELIALLENPDPSTQQAAAVLLMNAESKDERLPKFLDAALEGEKESAILSRLMIFQTYERLASEAETPLPAKVVDAVLDEIVSGDSNQSYSLPYLLHTATLTEEQVARLVKLFDDEDRANIAYSTLGYAKCAAPEKLVAAIFERLPKAEEDQQYQLVQVLVRNKESSWPGLTALVTNSKEPLAIRKVVLQSLAQMEKLTLPEGKPLVGLLKDENPAVRQWTAIALAKIAPKPDPLLPHLTAALGDKDYSVRSQASYALSEMGAKAAPALPELIKLLASEEEEIRSPAVETVRSIGPGAEAAVPALLVALAKTEEEYSREAIARALRRIGKPAEAPLLAALEQAQGEQRIALLPVFMHCRISAAVPQLKQSLANENVAERRAAAKALACYPEADEACVVVLAELAKDKDTEQASRGLQALAKMGERAKSALPVLQESLTHPQLVYNALAALRKMKSDAAPAVPALIELMENPNLTSEVGRVLGEIGSPAATEALIALLDNDSHAWVAAGSLAKIKPSPVAQALPKLYAKLRDPDRRIAAIGAIGSFGPEAKAAIPTLLKGMKANDNELRSSCISALANVGKGSPEVAEALLPLVDDADQEIQAVTIQSLGQIGALPKKCVPVLVKKLSTENVYIRSAAIRALGGFHAEAASAVPLLLKEPFENEETRWHVVNTLGEIGPPASAGVPQLVELMKSEKPESRYGVVEALGKIGPAAAAALPVLEPLTKDERPHIRIPALLAYWKIDPARAKQLGLHQPQENEEYEGEYDEDY
jgi:HEAT repeat protein